MSREELKRIAHELRAYSPAADEYKGEHIHKVWAKEIEAILVSAQDVARAPLQVEIRPIVMAGTPSACQVWLTNSADQQFAVGNPHETRGDGEWFADMLRKAIAPAAPAVKGRRDE